jgi:ArsR family transcriptional regulator
MSSPGPKLQLFEQFALVAKALGHAHRLMLLEQLAQGEQSVEVVAQKSGLSVANTSQHLQLMRRTGLVASRRGGKHVFYRLADAAVLDLLAALRSVGERNLAEVQLLLNGYFRDRDALEPITRPELITRMRHGEVVVLDVRPGDEFALGHVPSAINMPLDELASRLGELDPDTEIIAYCRGPYCIFAFEAVALLRSRGFRSRRLEGGMPEWKAAGMDCTVG